MQNLRDKLLKAGLVTQEQAEQAKTAPKPSVPKRAPAARPINERPTSERPIPKLPPLPGSKAHQREEAKRQREIDRRLLELVRAGDIPIESGPQTFYFQTRKGKLRRLELSAAQAKALEQGELAVVERQEPASIEHSLVRPETAEQMLALFPKSVRFFNKGGAPVGFLSEDEIKAQAELEPPADGERGETWIAVKRAAPGGDES